MSKIKKPVKAGFLIWKREFRVTKKLTPGGTSAFYYINMRGV